MFFVEESGALGGIRTHDHPLRRRMLYPTELRAQQEPPLAADLSDDTLV